MVKKGGGERVEKTKEPADEEGGSEVLLSGQDRAIALMNSRQLLFPEDQASKLR